MPDYLHTAPVSHGTSACASSAFASPTTNKIGAMVPAYFSITRVGHWHLNSPEAIFSVTASFFDHAPSIVWLATLKIVWQLSKCQCQHTNSWTSVIVGASITMTIIKVWTTQFNTLLVSVARNWISIMLGHFAQLTILTSDGKYCVWSLLDSVLIILAIVFTVCHHQRLAYLVNMFK